MPREHWNDVPGDIAAGDAEDLPGGFGTYNPDNNVEASIDEISENDVVGPDGTMIASQGQRVGDTAGTSYAEGVDTGSTVDPNDLVEGEEAHPGAGVGFTGGEMDKRVPPPSQRIHPHEDEEVGAGGTPDEARTPQQAQNISIETEGPVGGQGAAGAIQPPKGKKAA